MNEQSNFKTHKDLIQWRRGIVLQKLSQGKTQSAIAAELQLHPSTISLDCQFLKIQALENLKVHLQETVPFQYEKTISALTQVLDKAWEVANDKDSKKSEVLQSLALFSDTSQRLLNLATDRKMLAQSTDWAVKQMEHLQQQGQSDIQEEELED